LFGAFLFAVEFGDDFNFSNNILVKLAELFRWNPIFEMKCSAYLLHSELRKVACLYSESGDVPKFRLGVFRVPIARYLSGVFFVQGWIKDWLSRQPRRKGAVIGICYEAKFVRSDRTIENCGLFYSFGAESGKLARRFDVRRVSLWLRDGLSFFTQAVEVERKGFAHILFDFFAGATG
jgi:hypothetical protein